MEISRTLARPLSIRIGGPIGEADKLKTISITGGPVGRRPPAEFAGFLQTYQLE